MNLINNHWRFGHRIGLDFSGNVSTPVAHSPNSSPPAPIALSTREGCATVSNAAGQLLFYTDGLEIWPRPTSGVPPTGPFLKGHSTISQTVVIVPDPAGNADESFYVLTVDSEPGTSQDPDGGRFNVNTGTWTPLPATTWLTTPGHLTTEKSCLIRHAECDGYWWLTVLAAHPENPDVQDAILRLYKIDTAGIRHFSDTVLPEVIAWEGCMKASHDGKRIAIANAGERNAWLIDFDNLQGTFDIATRIEFRPVISRIPDHIHFVYGVEFSPDNQLLYLTVLGNPNPVPNPAEQMGFVMQAALSGNYPIHEVGAYPNNGKAYALGALQLGPDGLIYIAKDNEPSVAAIETPNVAVSPTINWSYRNWTGDGLCLMGLPALIPIDCESETPCNCPPSTTPASCCEQEINVHCGTAPPSACCPPEASHQHYAFYMSRVRLVRTTRRDGRADVMLTGYANGQSALLPGMGSYIALHTAWGWRNVNTLITEVGLPRDATAKIPVMADAIVVDNSAAGLWMGGSAQQIAHIQIGGQAPLASVVLQVDCTPFRNSTAANGHCTLEIEFVSVSLA